MSIPKQKGSSTVEFAVVLPILLILIVMVSELGAMFYRLNAVTKSVQIATRYLSDVSVNPEIGLTNAQVKNLVCFGSIEGFGAPIVPECNDKLEIDTTVAFDHITLTATYPANWMLPEAVTGLLNLSSDAMALKASGVMRFSQ
jgi:hypothetical protein